MGIVLLAVSTPGLAGCAQSSQTADLEKRVADADARTAAAERRLAAAAHAGDLHSAVAPATLPQPAAAQQLDPTAPQDAGNGSSGDTKYAPYRDTTSGPNKDVP